MHQNPAAENAPLLTPSLRTTLWSSRLIFAFLFFIVALLVRLPNFNESLWYDEVWYTFMRLNPNSINRVLFHDVHPPLYPLLMLGWIKLFGDSEIAVRLPSLLFGLASLGVIFALARSWFNRCIAFLSTILMALSPVHIWYSQENKNNMLLLLLTVLTVYGLQQAWDKNRRQHWLLFIVAAILALWTNHFSLWIILSAFLWLWLNVLWERGRPRVKWAVMSSIVVALCYLPAALLTLIQLKDLGRSYLRPFTLGEVYKLFLIYLSNGNTLRAMFPWAPFRTLGVQSWGFFLIEGFFAFLLISGLLVVGRRWLMHRKKAFAAPFPCGAGNELLLVYLLLPPIFLLLASLYYSQIYVERSMIILLPPFMILTACGVMAFSRLRWHYIVLSGLLLLNSWSLFNLWVAKADTWTVWIPKPDWQSTAQYFENQITKSSEEFIIVLITPATTLNYYYSRIIKSKGAEKPHAYPPELPIVQLRKRRDNIRFFNYDRTEFLNLLSVNKIDTFYLIHNRYWAGRFYRLFRNVRKDRRFQLLGKTSFKGIEIFKFRVLSLS